MILIDAIDLIGTFVFAISGALTASNKKFDLLGVSIIAFITALGGGTVRDLLIGSTPVGWMSNTNYLLIILGGVLTAFFFKRYLEPLRKTMFLFDAIGLGAFSIGGLEKALSLGIEPIYAIICGMISATMGGATRDVLCNEIPLIFRREIYATAGLIGAGLYFLLQFAGLSEFPNFSITVIIVIAIRILAVKYNVGLPQIK